MLHTFISSGFRRSHDRAGALASVVVHTGLIALAVSATSVPVRFARDHDPVRPEHLEFLASFRSARTLTGSGARSQRPVPHRDPLAAAMHDLAALHVAVDPLAAPAVPDVDYAALATRALTFVSAAGDWDPLGPGAPPDPSRVYTEYTVEHTVLPRDGNPKPVYPLPMEDMGIGASFVVHFVVDTTGRVDDHSIEFPSTTHRMFIDAVRRALMRSRFWPAEIAGQRVRQLVEQTFTFRLAQP